MEKQAQPTKEDIKKATVFSKEQIKAISVMKQALETEEYYTKTGPLTPFQGQLYLSLNPITLQNGGHWKWTQSRGRITFSITHKGNLYDVTFFKVHSRSRRTETSFYIPFGKVWLFSAALRNEETKQKQCIDHIPIKAFYFCWCEEMELILDRKLLQDLSFLTEFVSPEIRAEFGCFIFQLMSVLVQYVVVRSDLIKKLAWPVGPVLAQACHASVAALFSFKEDPNVIQYTDQLESMHKVILEISSEEKLRNLSSKLTENNIDHHLWIEQPDNIATALALKPYEKEQVQRFLKKCNLFK